MDENGGIDQIMETYTDKDANSSTYLQTLYVYNPLYNMELNSSNESKSFGFRNNFEIDWRIYDELQSQRAFQHNENLF